MSGQGIKRERGGGGGAGGGGSGNEGNMGGGGKKMRGDSITLRFLLQSKHAGGIIGKGGQTIKRLRSEYNATVSVPDTNAPERVLSIAAGQECAISVLRECLPLCHEPPFLISGGNNDGGAGGNQFEVNFLVHSSQVGGIIGRAGSNIKELRESTGTNIKVFQECLPNSTERVVAIGARSEDGVIDVINRVLGIMQEQPIKGNISLYDPSMEPWDQGQNNYSGGGPMQGGNRGGGRGGMRGGRGGGRGAGRGGFNNQGFGGNNNNSGSGGSGGGGNFGGSQEQANNFHFGNGPSQDFASDYNQGDGSNFGKGNPETTQVTIPNDLAGAIIGKGGERIRNIRQRSGADIKIQDPLPGKADRVITISGNPEQIQYGQFLMQQSVRQFSGKHNT